MNTGLRYAGWSDVISPLEDVFNALPRFGSLQFGSSNEQHLQFYYHANDEQIVIHHSGKSGRSIVTQFLFRSGHEWSISDITRIVVGKRLVRKYPSKVYVLYPNKFEIKTQTKVGRVIQTWDALDGSLMSVLVQLKGQTFVRYEYKAGLLVGFKRFGNHSLIDSYLRLMDRAPVDPLGVCLAWKIDYPSFVAKFKRDSKISLFCESVAGAQSYDE